MKTGLHTLNVPMDASAFETGTQAPASNDDDTANTTGFADSGEQTFALTLNALTNPALIEDPPQAPSTDMREPLILDAMHAGSLDTVLAPLPASSQVALNTLLGAPTGARASTSYAATEAEPAISTALAAAGGKASQDPRASYSTLLAPNDNVADEVVPTSDPRAHVVSFRQPVAAARAADRAELDGASGAATRPPVTDSNLLTDVMAIASAPTAQSVELVTSSGSAAIAAPIALSASVRPSLDGPAAGPTTGAHAAVDIPVGTNGWDEAFGARVVIAARTAQQAADIRINPQDLGPVNVQLSVSEERASVSFIAHHAATREAIEMALPKLREMFNQSGLELVHVDVEARQDTTRGDANQRPADAIALADDQEPSRAMGDDSAPDTSRTWTHHGLFDGFA